MPRIRLTTYQDCVEHLLDYLGASSDDQSERFCRRAVQDACNALPGKHQWSYFQGRGRIQTVAPYSTGTITYTQSTRTITLAGGTFPSWALQGVIVFTTSGLASGTGNTPYSVASFPTSTTLTLSPQSNPGADVAALTTYTLYQDSYRMPIDFSSADEVINTNFGHPLEYTHISEWLSRQRVYRGPATPRMYSFSGSPLYFGAMAMRLFPAPDNVYNLDFIYKRRPRQVNVINYLAGTASTTSGSTTVTGSGTVWTSDMVGSSIRFSDTGNRVPPTGPSGENPFLIERTILAVANNTSLTVDADPANTLTGVNYAISDMVEMEEGAMLSYFLRLCEKQLRRGRRIEPTGEEEKAYFEAFTEAREADSRSTTRQVAGSGGMYRRLRDFPSGSDQG